MKYIRTKDGVYDTSKGIYTPSIKMWAIGIATIYDDDILKQTDTIEELCDDFVVDWLPTNHKDIFSIDEYSKKVIESCIGNNKTNIYGTIWTDKGLIYVAKMNENGVFELI